MGFTLVFFSIECIFMLSFFEGEESGKSAERGLAQGAMLNELEEARMAITRFRSRRLSE